MCRMLVIAAVGALLMPSRAMSQGESVSPLTAEEFQREYAEAFPKLLQKMSNCEISSVVVHPEVVPSSVESSVGGLG